MAEEMVKKCPYCAENINTDAKVCKHCGRTIDVVLQEMEHARHSLRASDPIIINNNNNNNNGNPNGNSDRHADFAPKSRFAYIILAFFLGMFGVHNFYAARTGSGIIQLLLNVLLFWTGVIPIIVALWVLIEMLVVNTDGHGIRMR